MFVPSSGQHLGSGRPRSLICLQLLWRQELEVVIFLVVVARNHLEPILTHFQLEDITHSLPEVGVLALDYATVGKPSLAAPRLG